jgi:hypothetical protein
MDDPTRRLEAAGNGMHPLSLRWHRAHEVIVNLLKLNNPWRKVLYNTLNTALDRNLRHAEYVSDFSFL